MKTPPFGLDGATDGSDSAFGASQNDLIWAFDYNSGQYYQTSAPKPTPSPKPPRLFSEEGRVTPRKPSGRSNFIMPRWHINGGKSAAQLSPSEARKRRSVSETEASQINEVTELNERANVRTVRWLEGVKRAVADVHDEEEECLTQPSG